MASGQVKFRGFWSLREENKGNCKLTSFLSLPISGSALLAPAAPSLPLARLCLARPGPARPGPARLGSALLAPAAPSLLSLPPQQCTKLGYTLYFRPQTGKSSVFSDFDEDKMIWRKWSVFIFSGWQKIRQDSQAFSLYTAHINRAVVRPSNKQDRAVKKKSDVDDLTERTIWCKKVLLFCV